MNFIDARIENREGQVLLMVENYPVTLKEELQKKLSSHVGEPVEVGVRSHQAYLTE